MPNLYRLMSNVRLRLGMPRANCPGDALLLHQVCTHARVVLQHRQNTGNPWDFRDTFIDTDVDEDTYQIFDSSFGKPLAVLTRDESNPSHTAQAIPFYCPQNLNFDWGEPNWGGPAQRCAIFWRQGSPYVQFEMPRISAQYQIRYSVGGGGVDAASLSSEVTQSEDCDLVEIRAARSLLPMAEWEGNTKDGRVYNAEKRRELAQTLTADEGLTQRQFEASVLLTTGPAVSHRWFPD